ncbi:hypothetical protein PSTT_04866 [Puccinia striiformis]|uniref:Uncharacterized protein n=1 Tax=Puccinia striiformis TaxID=27350 RepID=A0A2S4VR95_9BASI|nr:hypothetical protein PSTT_04866 [Puccinia striiformis]
MAYENTGHVEVHVDQFWSLRALELLLISREPSTENNLCLPPSSPAPFQLPIPCLTQATHTIDPSTTHLSQLINLFTLHVLATRFIHIN